MACILGSREGGSLSLRIADLLVVADGGDKANVSQ